MLLAPCPSLESTTSRSFIGRGVHDGDTWVVGMALGMGNRFVRLASSLLLKLLGVMLLTLLLMSLRDPEKFVRGEVERLDFLWVIPN